MNLSRYRLLFCCLSSLTFLPSCQPKHNIENEADFVAIKSLDSVKSSCFAFTMQDTLPSGKNIFYTPTLLFAWKELHGQIGKFNVPANNAEAVLLENSKTFLGSLNDSEYSNVVAKAGEEITIKSSFDISLPFKAPLDTIKNGSFKFCGTPVRAFGKPKNTDNINDQVFILYYNNDSDFVVKLMPRNGKHAIILAMGITGSNFIEILNHVNGNIHLGDSEIKISANGWKYFLGLDDELMVPDLNINFINYCHFLTGLPISKYFISNANQRIAFKLNETGGHIKSEAEVEEKSDSFPPPPEQPIEKPHSKKLIFNKPFVLFLIKADAKYPYFMAKVSNTDIMKKY